MKRDGKGWMLMAVMLLLILGVAFAQREALWPVKEQMDPEVVHAALLEYGYPEVVIQAMSVGAKEQTCREQVYFHKAELVYYTEEGEKLLQISLDSDLSGEQEQWLLQDLPEYDLALAMVNGFRYEGEAVEYALCSLHYHWTKLPKTRKEEPLRMSWKSQQMWVRDDGYYICASRMDRDGAEELLLFEHNVALAGPSGLQWYTELHDIGRRGRYGFSGSAMVEIEPRDGIDSVMIQGSLTHRHDESSFLSSERMHEIVFQTGLELIWPKEKEERQ